jgi:hypothetical protein
MVWKVWAPSRCKFFLWLMVQNRIWTADRLLMREWPNEYFCLLCRRNLEIVQHLFIECPIIRQIWLEISNWASWPPFHPQSWPQHPFIDVWISSLSRSSASSSVKVKGARSLAILVCWSVRRERNCRIFQGREKTVSHLVSEIKDEAHLWMTAGAKHLATLVVHRLNE